MTLQVLTKSFSPNDSGGYDAFGTYYTPSTAEVNDSFVEEVFVTFNASSISQFAATLVDPEITITYTLSNSDFLQTQQIQVESF